MASDDRDRVFREVSATGSRTFAKIDSDCMATKYIGPVSTRNVLFESFNATLKFSASRTMDYVRDDVSSMIVAFPGFYIAGFVEVPFGATTAVTGSIEYPVGRFTQLKFGGQVTGTIPNGGLLFSDPIAVAIPRGAQFWIQTWTNCAAGSGYHGWAGPGAQFAGGNEVFAYNTTSLADTTMNGAIVSTDAANIGGPALVLGLTNRPSVAFIGDSRAHGQFDAFTGLSGDIGEFARAIGPLYAYAQCGAGGDSASGWATSHANRLILASFASHAIVQYGINDINLLAHTDAAIRADVLSIIAGLPASQVKFIATMPPCTNTTDNYATIANQTVLVGEPTRLANNAWRRTVPAGFAGCIDVASVVESIASPGKWNVDGTAFKWTADGVHESPFGYQQIAASGVVPTNLVVP